MAVGQDSTVFFPNNRAPTSPTRGNCKIKPKSNVQTQQTRCKLPQQLDTSPDQLFRGKQFQPGRTWNKGRHSPSKQVSPKTPPSSPVGVKTPQGCAPFYAGFTESPAPGSLPKPPSHWVVPAVMSSGLSPSELSLGRQSLIFKTFMDVHA